MSTALHSSHSLVELEGVKLSDRCRYCTDTMSPKPSWCMKSHQLNARDYKILMDGGWRRHGNNVYKTLSDKTCCPAYTIRCDCEHFRISRGQKKTLAAVVAFLKRGEKPGEIVRTRNASIMEFNKAPILFEGGRSDAYTSACDCFSDPMKFGSPLPSIEISTSEDSGIMMNMKEIFGIGRSGSSKRKRWQALQERMARKAEKTGVPYEDILNAYLERRKKRLGKNKPRDIEEYLELEKPSEKSAHFLDIRLCKVNPQSDELKAAYEREYQMFYDYQICIHKADPATATREHFNEFLVDSTLVSDFDPKAEAAGAPQFGTYHQQYWLDGKTLIAVGVIDLVPGCLSSVYFFYDPMYSFMNLGTYSALREIALVRHLHKTFGSVVPAYADFTQYYLGYYIHTTPKMRYKASFAPSYLVCPETNTWVPVERCLRILQRVKYARLADRAGEKTRNCDDGDTKILLPYTNGLVYTLPKGSFVVKGNAVLTTLAEAERFLAPEKIKLVKEWADLVGPKGNMCIRLF